MSFNIKKLKKQKTKKQARNVLRVNLDKELNLLQMI